MRDDADAGSGAARGRRHANHRRRALDPAREPLPTRVEAFPSFRPSTADALDAGLAALGLTLAGGAAAAIDGHVRLLLAWTAAINLTAIRDPARGRRSPTSSTA